MMLLGDENKHLNSLVMNADFKKGNYLKGIKHGFYVSKKDREAMKLGKY